MHLFSQYDDHERNYKQVNDVFFTHFELGYLTSYNILTEFINTTPMPPISQIKEDMFNLLVLRICTSKI